MTLNTVGHDMKISIAERFAILRVMNEAENLSRTDLRHVIKIADKVSIGADEAKEIGMVESPNGGLTWKTDQPAREIAITTEECAFLKKHLDATDGKLSIKRGDGRHTLSLMDKLDEAAKT